jgi:regulator of ribosome biosynthesis
VPGDERIKSRGKRRQFDSVTDMGKEKTNSLGFIDKLMRVGLGLGFRV